MVKKPQKPPLKLVTEMAVTDIEPPRNLGNCGRSLWDRIMAEYDIQDAGGIELLLLACEGIDRIGMLREEIQRDGAVIRVRGVVKEHPALRAEIATMSFVTRTLARLGLDLEPLKSIGRPPSAMGWVPTA
jgi:hypothetical protein